MSLAVILRLEVFKGAPVLQVEEEMPTAVFFNGGSDTKTGFSRTHKVVSLIDVAGSPRYAKVSLNQV